MENFVLQLCCAVLCCDVPRHSRLFILQPHRLRWFFFLLAYSSLLFNFLEERKLAMDEKPLLVQLNWHKDDREGRFLLRRLDDKTNVRSPTCFRGKPTKY